jgi:hypothetical protein
MTPNALPRRAHALHCTRFPHLITPSSRAGHVSYKSAKMHDLHIYLLQQLSSQQIVRVASGGSSSATACLQSPSSSSHPSAVSVFCTCLGTSRRRPLWIADLRTYCSVVTRVPAPQVLLPNVGVELWVDRATEAIMKSICAFKKWRKEAESAGLEHRLEKHRERCRFVHSGSGGDEGLCRAVFTVPLRSDVSFRARCPASAFRLARPGGVSLVCAGTRSSQRERSGENSPRQGAFAESASSRAGNQLGTACCAPALSSL